MKIKLSDISLMLDIIFDYTQYFEREDNEKWYDEVESLRDKLYNILDSTSKKIQKKNG